MRSLFGEHWVGTSIFGEANLEQRLCQWEGRHPNVVWFHDLPLPQKVFKSHEQSPSKGIRKSTEALAKQNNNSNI